MSSFIIQHHTNIFENNNKVLDLNEPVNKWADALLGSKEKERIIDQAYIEKKIAEAGFDIQIESIKLQKMYEEMANET